MESIEYDRVKGHEARSNVNSVAVGCSKAGDVGSIAVVQPVKVLIQGLGVMEQRMHQVKPGIMRYKCHPVQHRDVSVA